MRVRDSYCHTLSGRVDYVCYRSFEAFRLTQIALGGLNRGMSQKLLNILKGGVPGYGKAVRRFDARHAAEKLDARRQSHSVTV